MKQHPLCSDCERDNSIADLPIPAGIKNEWAALETRRRFLGRSGKVLGWAALASLFGEAALRGDTSGGDARIQNRKSASEELKLPHFAPKAKRAIYLFMSGGPPQIDLLDHEPAIMLMNTGNMNAGKPCLGSWLSYGLGSMNDNLPTFIVLQTKVNSKENNQPVSSRLWGSGFLSSEYAGVGLRSGGNPVLYLADPAGVDREVRRRMLDAVEQINRQTLQDIGDPETNARIAQYEMAYRMQASVPELADLSKEPQSTWDLYGPEAKEPGTFAYNCLLARRMAERGVRFTQIYKRGWDVHDNVTGVLPIICGETDRGCYALVTDLKRRGLLDDTLVIWAGEFGRTVYSQGGLTPENYGRDHHPRCFTTWMTGGGVRPGITYGETDDYSYNVVKDPVHVRDFNATILHCLGIDHNKFTYKFQGLDQKLTGPTPASIVPGLLA